MWLNPQFHEEILNGKLQFLYSVSLFYKSKTISVEPVGIAEKEIRVWN